MLKTQYFLSESGCGDEDGGTTSYHCGDFVEALQIFHNLGLVGRLHAGEAACVRDGVPLGLGGQLVKLPSREGHELHVVVLSQDADAAADGHGRALVVARDHDDSDARLAAQHDGRRHFLSGRVQHAHAAHEGEVGLQGQTRGQVTGRTNAVVAINSIISL